MPGCQFSRAVTITPAPEPSPYSNRASASASASIAASMACRSRFRLVQPLRDHLGLRGIIYRQQSAAERRIADAAAGIDARPDQETEMIGCDRSAEPGLLEQRSKTCIVHVARGNQPFDHIGAVEALQRHHITYGGKRNDIEKGQQIECEGLPVPPVLQ